MNIRAVITPLSIYQLLIGVVRIKLSWTYAGWMKISYPAYASDVCESVQDTDK